MSALRPAVEAEVANLWPLARAARIAGTADEFALFRASGPWRVQVSDAGEVAILDRWRAHLGVCSMLGLWARAGETARLIVKVAAVARAQGFSELLSPLMPVKDLGSYRDAGMTVRERIVALQAPVGLVARRDSRPGVKVRPARAMEIEALAAIDAECFDDFWHYGAPELAHCLEHERTVVAEGPWGELLGYATCTVRSGTATLGRLAVKGSARRRGTGALLVGEAAGWAERAGAVTFTLCTQEDNAGSRALYAAAGLDELETEYALASMGLPSRLTAQEDTL